MFGPVPAYGLYARHVRNLSVRNVSVGFAAPEERPPVVLDDVAGVEFNEVTAARGPGVPFFVLRGVREFAAYQCAGLPDTRRESAARETL